MAATTVNIQQNFAAFINYKCLSKLQVSILHLILIHVHKPSRRRNTRLNYDLISISRELLTMSIKLPNLLRERINFRRRYD
jgi:hypothetical protein